MGGAVTYTLLKKEKNLEISMTSSERYGASVQMHVM